MDFARQVSDVLGGAVGLEVVHPTLLDVPVKVVDGVVGIRADALYKAFGEVSRLGQFRTPEGSLLALIATTEHNSAINYRRKLLVDGELDPKAELHLLDLLQTSHLPKQTKSPQLWSHRRFLLDKFGLCDLDHEFDVVVQAGKNHPRNYYAWSYLRSLHTKPPMWDLCMANLSDVSMWTYLASIDNGVHVDAAKDLLDKWGPHESITAYIRNSPEESLKEK